MVGMLLLLRGLLIHLFKKLSRCAEITNLVLTFSH
jgi:hypothetical protein